MDGKASAARPLYLKRTVAPNAEMGVNGVLSDQFHDHALFMDFNTICKRVSGSARVDGCIVQRQCLRAWVEFGRAIPAG